jgi:DNA-binding LacI/PurR family transcriptional regulator
MLTEIFNKNKGLFKNSKVIFLVIGICICLVLLFMVNTGSKAVFNSDLKKVEKKYEATEFEVLLSQINGAGRTNAYINHDKDTGEVKGVIIVSEGAEDLKVKIMLTNAASTALNISADKIEVFEMKKGD